MLTILSEHMLACTEIYFRVNRHKLLFVLFIELIIIYLTIITIITTIAFACSDARDRLHKLQATKLNRLRGQYKISKTYGFQTWH